MPLMRRKYGRRLRRRARKPAAGRRYGRYGIRARLQRAFNPTPSFVETYKDTSVVQVTPGTGVGVAFKVRITDLPQVNQYANLYKQYRINWVKVMLVPKINTEQADPNSAIYNSLVGATQWMGMGRIVYAINDSPDVVAPASEQEVLECNGAKIQAFRTKWSCSFRPVPDIGMSNPAGGNVVYSKSKIKPWLNFDTHLSTNNPLHGSVSAYISLPGNAGAVGEPFQQIYYVYYKMSFSLRDPQ